jgi:hypothetical protein
MRSYNMGRSHYFVMFDGEAWKIQCDGENSDPYPHKRDAFRDAVALAHLDDKNGRPADVIVQCENEMFRPEWDSSRDPYPPPLAPDLGGPYTE